MSNAFNFFHNVPLFGVEFLCVSLLRRVIGFSLFVDMMKPRERQSNNIVNQKPFKLNPSLTGNKQRKRLLQNFWKR